MKIYKNISYYKHNFGTCNMTDFDVRGYVPNVLRACGSNQKSCSKDCKFYVDEMDTHRCMKGAERNRYYRMLLDGDNATATAVWRARAVCAKSKKPSHAIKPSALPSFIVAFVIIVAKLLIG